MSVATRNIVDEGIDSPTSEETERHEINEIVESSVSYFQSRAEQFLYECQFLLWAAI